jgi:Flp pilus assembly protein TadD
VQRSLVEALYGRGELRLEYDSAITRNAAQAFEARSGNCLSLVIMSAAIARRLGMVVQYQSLFTEESVSHRAGMWLVVDHINLRVGKRLSDFGAVNRLPEAVTIDFLPPGDASRQRVRQLAENTVLALYMNNRAVEALGRGEIDNAYWWAREAVVSDPTLPRAYNTLGVVFRRHGNVQAAESALVRGLALDGENLPLLANLVQVYHDQGRAEEAVALSARLAKLEQGSLAALYELAHHAMRRGEHKRASQLLERAVALAPDFHELHYWLAVELSRLGEARRAAEHLARAIEVTPVGKEREFYAAKLARFRASAPH